VATLRDHICHLEGKLKESDCDKEQLEATLGGQIKEMCAHIGLVRCEANQAKINWKKIEGALRGRIKEMEKRIADDIDRNYVEDSFRSQINELKATIRKRDTANEWTLLVGIMNMFRGKEGGSKDIEEALRRKIKELKKDLEEKEWCLEEIRKQQ
jgi:hypothetical protein